MNYKSHMLYLQTRIFVTHGVTYLPDCDHIIVLKAGKIEDSGSYNELTSRLGPFSDVLVSYLENEGGDDLEEEEAEGWENLVNNM